MSEMTEEQREALEAKLGRKLGPGETEDDPYSDVGDQLDLDVLDHADGAAGAAEGEGAAAAGAAEGAAAGDKAAAANAAAEGGADQVIKYSGKVDRENKSHEYWRGEYDTLIQRERHFTGRLGNLTAERNSLQRRVAELEEKVASAAPGPGQAILESEHVKALQEDDPVTYKAIETLAKAIPGQQQQAAGAPASDANFARYQFEQEMSKNVPDWDGLRASPDFQAFNNEIMQAEVQQQQMQRSRGMQVTEHPVAALGRSNDVTSGLAYVNHYFQARGATAPTGQPAAAAGAAQPAALRGARPTKGGGAPAGAGKGVNLTAQQEFEIGLGWRNEDGSLKK